MRLDNLHLVKFSTGLFGIRKGWVFHRYFDFSAYYNNYFWSKSNKYFITDCMTNEDKAKMMYIALICNPADITDTVII